LDGAVPLDAKAVLPPKEHSIRIHMDRSTKPQLLVQSTPVCRCRVLDASTDLLGKPLDCEHVIFGESRRSERRELISLSGYLLKLSSKRVHLPHYSIRYRVIRGIREAQCQSVKPVLARPHLFFHHLNSVATYLVSRVMLSACARKSFSQVRRVKQGGRKIAPQN